jgi:hypothetical protein
MDELAELGSSLLDNLLMRREVGAAPRASLQAGAQVGGAATVPVGRRG